jgi:hypothetical protein
MIDRNRSSFKAKECLDKEFPSNFLFAVDSRYQIWLNQCQIATTHSVVNNTIIIFYPLVLQVLFGSFHISLPPTFSMKTPKATATRTRKNYSNQKEKGKESGHKKKKGKANKA